MLPELPEGFSYHPSRDNPERVIARVADPSRKNTVITKAASLKNGPVDELLVELTEWRNEVGSQLWESWPDVTRGRVSNLVRGLPRGISCFITTVRPKHRKPYLSLRVYCYWQAYSEGRNASGNYPQRNKSWSLPLYATREEIEGKIREAEAYLQKMRSLNPKPSRTDFFKGV